MTGFVGFVVLVFYTNMMPTLVVIGKIAQLALFVVAIGMAILQFLRFRHQQKAHAVLELRFDEMVLKWRDGTIQKWQLGTDPEVAQLWIAHQHGYEPQSRFTLRIRPLNVTAPGPDLVLRMELSEKQKRSLATIFELWRWAKVDFVETESQNNELPKLTRNLESIAKKHPKYSDLHSQATDSASWQLLEEVCQQQASKRPIPKA
jgi:hypothetical protein